MRPYILAAALAVSPAFASTEMVARSGDNEVRIYEQKCEIASVLRHIPEQLRSQFRKARAKIEGQTYFACYIVANGGAMLVYEDGDQGFIPAGDFKEPNSI